MHALREEEKLVNTKLTDLKQAAANKEKIMHALHEYNDVKDVTQIVLGQLADLYGVTVTELHKKFDLPINS